MIQSKKDLADYIAADHNSLIFKNVKSNIIANITCYPTHVLRKYLYYLRKQEFISILLMVIS